MKDGQIILLENLRFHRQETQNDTTFAKELGSLGDIYVNDAFGTVHRTHASIERITKFIDCCVMGFLINRELAIIGKALACPRSPFIAILGGSKASTKLNVIENLLPKVDLLILGGAMAFTFLKAKKVELGESVFEADKIPIAKKLLKNFSKKILLPTDHLITNCFDHTKKNFGYTKNTPTNTIEHGWYGIDIGKETIAKFTGVLSYSKTILWNGPLGIFENNEASHGTFSVAKAVAEETKNGAVTIVGGGDSSLAIAKAELTNNISHISTGGGASLNLIGGLPLPGVIALTDCL